MPNLQSLLQKVLDAVIVMRCDGTVADWNGCAAETFGWTRAEALGRSMNDLIVPAQHRTAHSHGLKRYLETGIGAVIDKRIEISALTKAGVELPIELTITEAQYDGERVFVGFVRDISERKNAELALRMSESRLATTYNHAFAGIGETDENGRFLRANEQFCKITGYTLQELRELSIFSITHAEDVTTDREQFARQWSGEIENYALEKRYVRKDGEIVWVEVAASIVRADGELRPYAVRIVRDISQRKAAERHQHLLLSELQHRVKNSLTIVQSLALQSFKGDAVSPEQVRLFEARLAALANAHDLLVKQNWTPTPLLRIAEQGLRPFDLESRFKLAGEEVLIDPQTAVTFTLALHELATNAVKYGALSLPTGHVRLTWQISDNRLSIRWEERGGPPVSAPLKSGFGTRLLEKALARQLQGQVLMEFKTSGLTCTIDAPKPLSVGS